MKELQCSQERFLNDIKDHEMTIVKNDGVFRHVQFRKPGTNCYMFHLTTWPGHLCISGDMGTAVFSRITDMFEFFYEPEDRRENGLFINPGYWSEKLQGFSSSNRYRSAQEYSPSLAIQSIKDHVERELEEALPEPEDYSEGEEDLYAEYREELDEFNLQLAELEAELDEYIYDGAEAESEEVMVSRIHDWENKTDMPRMKHLFEEFFCDGSPHWTEYTFHYIWLCYAISHGVIQYYNSKGEPDVSDE